MKQIKQINKHGVFFGLHLYRKPEAPVFYSCMKNAAMLLRKHGYKLDYGLVTGDPYIQKARNELVSQFLKSDSNIFFFIADDLEYSPEDMLKVIKTPGELVVGVYSQHIEPANYPVKIYVNSDKTPIVRKDGCVSAMLVQTGFMRIHRNVFEKIAKVHPELEYYGMKDGKKIDAAHDFFPQGVYGHSWLGEDYAFCKLWLEFGGKIWVQPDLNLTHYKDGKGYAGNFHEYLMRLPGGCKEGDK
jgi:hypothetical protein